MLVRDTISSQISLADQLSLSIENFLLQSLKDISKVCERLLLLIEKVLGAGRAAGQCFMLGQEPSWCWEVQDENTVLVLNIL